ncbi:hypothetical protein PYCCODRAFT_728810 [Trametes coccinea BRFM310]|uniref:Uncharacterized protein n=1 Tax=Trametes coccinea (strain BRFM310) TaxID=1353009 RepID=A0A1Y2IFZ1_TRAC3|nr:hypothetical protein PYCCODRAFT_728810 [Trametes coccinea BRFM310]
MVRSPVNHSLIRAVIRGGQTLYHEERARPQGNPTTQHGTTYKPRQARSRFDIEAEKLSRDNLQMGKRIIWAACLVVNREEISLLDVEETFAGVWPGRPEEGGSGGGEWVRLISKANREPWKSLKVVNIRTEERLLEFYQELVSTGTSQDGWSQVESLSLDTQLNADALSVLVDCLPRMSLRRLRLVVYSGDKSWQVALGRNGMLGNLFSNLPLLEELIIDCPWDVLESGCAYPGTLDEWTAAIAQAPQLKTFTVAEALILRSASQNNAWLADATMEEKVLVQDGEDSGYFSGSEAPLFDVPLNGTLDPPFTALDHEDRLRTFACKLFDRLSANDSVNLREVLFLPQRSFWAKCTVQVYRRGQSGAQARPYKRFWEHDWREWEWMPPSPQMKSSEQK